MSPMDTTFLKPLYEAQGGIVSVYIDTEDITAQADHVIGTRWKQLRKRLHADGADDATLDAIEAGVGSDRGRPRPPGQAIFAADQRVVLMEELRRPPAEDDSRIATLPHTLPLLTRRSGRAPWIIAFAARTGTDFEVWDASGRLDTRRFDGETDYAHRVKTAGASEWRLEHDAQEVWSANAKLAAEHLAHLADRYRPDLIVAAGDAHGRTLLADHLGAPWRGRTVVLPEGSRAAGADRDRQREAAESIAAELEHEARTAVMERYRRGLVDGGAVEGLAETVDFVRRGEVDTLLLHNGSPVLEAPLWWDAEPGQLATGPDELLAVHPAQERRDPAAEVLVRAVTTTGGRLLVTSGGEPGPAGGVGALLRHT